MRGGTRGGQGRPLIRVLIAEDVPVIRETLAALLGLELDIRVVAMMASGDQIVPAAVEHHPDVAVLDIGLPEVDGLTAAAELASRVPGCRVLILTGLEAPGNLHAARHAGVTGFLLKDGPAGELAAAVRAVARGERVIDSRLAGEALDRARRRRTHRRLNPRRVPRVTMHHDIPGPGWATLQPHSPDGDHRGQLLAEPLSAAAGLCARNNGQAGGLIRLSGRIPHGGDTQSIILSPGQRQSPADPGKAWPFLPSPDATAGHPRTERQAANRKRPAPTPRPLPCPRPPEMIRSRAAASRTPDGAGYADRAPPGP
jgi:two-component system, NarL family, response regulator DesR